MKIQMRITGGLGGPASWQDIEVDAMHPQFPNLTAAFQKELASVGAETTTARSAIPDGMVYAIEFDDGNSVKRLVGNDGMSRSFRALVNSLKRYGKSTSDDQRRNEKP